MVICHPTVVATQVYRSCVHPLGLAAVIFAALQSFCCHIWKKRCTGSPVLSVICVVVMADLNCGRGQLLSCDAPMIEKGPFANADG